VSPELRLVVLFSVATAVAIATRRLAIPYTVALVLAGLALGATRIVPGAHLTKELLYAVFLPGLIFEAAYNLTMPELRANARAIFGLAVPGVIVATIATAWLLVTSSKALAPSFSWGLALVFSSLIAATDPIAVVALFKTLGAPRRLSVLVEGESLVNDGTAAVHYAIVLSHVTGEATGSIASGALDLVLVCGAGGAIGALIGFAASALRRRVREPMLEIALTTLAAYGSFAVAEQAHASGIIATVVAGIVCRHRASLRTVHDDAAIAVESFWRYAAFALNSLVFLLIGLEVRISMLLAAWRPILLAFAAVTVGRALVVLLASALLSRTNERIPWRFGLVITWGGLRGALSMVLALALPVGFPQRELIVTTTFGVVLLSIVLQGTTAGSLLRRLKLDAETAPVSQ